MTIHADASTGLQLSGQPMSTPLRDVRALSKQLVGHFVSSVAPCGTLPGDAIAGDITAVTKLCLEVAVSMLDGREMPVKVERLSAAAAGWAREGVPIDTILHSIHEGFKIGMALVTDRAATTDHDSLVDGVQMVLEILDLMNSTVAKAYVREHKAVVAEHHTAVHTLTSALLGGHATSTMARECGIEIAGSYTVLALSFPPHPDESNPQVDGQIVARRKLRRIQGALAVHRGPRVLSLLSVDGGTVLLPEVEGAAPVDVEALVARLGHVAQVPVTATLVTATTAEVPTAADQAHELLDMVHRLGSEPGLYRFTDLVLEYQLTRPGPGRESLGKLLDPLDDHPELRETLQVHIGNNLNRQRTARLLHVHTNTVDYRLKRIGYLTGLDPTQPSGLWYLRSALIARSFRQTERERLAG
ncbi:PucR family transcriptional regulator [Nocardia thailandica]